MDNGDLGKKRSWLWRGSFRASFFSRAVWVCGMDPKHFPFSPLSKPSHKGINLAALGTDERYFSDIILFFLGYNIEGKRAISLKTQILKSWNTVCQTWRMNDLIQVMPLHNKMTSLKHHWASCHAILIGQHSPGGQGTRGTSIRT